MKFLLHLSVAAFCIQEVVFQWPTAPPALPKGGFASQSSGISARNSTAHTQNTSLTASVSASRVTNWSTSASPVLPDAPIWESCCRKLVAAEEAGWTLSVSTAWWNSPRCCHSVTDAAVDTLEPMVRQKLARPEALAMSSPGRPDR